MNWDFSPGAARLVAGMACGVAALLAASPAAAQLHGYQPPAVPVPCELHVWPTNSFEVAIQSWADVLGGGALAGLLDGGGVASAKDVKPFMLDTFRPETQVEALKALDLKGLLDASEVSVTAEAVPAKDAVAGMKSKPIRNSASQSPCYIELILSHILFMQAATIPKQVRIHWTLRRFQTADAKPIIIKGNTAQRLTDYPGEAKVAPDVVRNDLVGNYRKAFVELIEEEVRGKKSAD